MEVSFFSRNFAEHSKKLNMDQIKNIAFDLGGVVIALNLEQAIQAFERIGLKDARQQLDAYKQKGLFADLESGKITAEEFRVGLSEQVGHEVTAQDCFDIIHCFVDHVPQRHLEVIQQIRKKGYKVCLLSNTNPIMMEWVRSAAFDGQGHSIDYYFDRLYLSYECGVMKPSPEIFQMMLQGQGARPEETLFIDDSQKNVEVAASLGIRTLCPKNNEDWTVFPEIRALYY